MEFDRAIELHRVETSAGANIQANTNSTLVQVCFTVRILGGQPQHGHHRIPLEDDDAYIRDSLERIPGEGGGGLHQIFHNGDVWGSRQGIEASQNVGKVAFEHGNGYASARSFYVIVA